MVNTALLYLELIAPESDTNPDVFNSDRNQTLFGTNGEVLKRAAGRYVDGDGTFYDNHWHEQIGDPTLADAILDRLVHSVHKIKLKGESMRKKNANLT